MRKLILILFMSLGFLNLQSQDVKYARYIIDSLCSPALYGRAYTNNGAQNASEFIANEFSKIKLNKFGDNYFQDYLISINSFTKDLAVKIGKKQLLAGPEFMVSLSSPSVKGSYKVVKLDSSNFICKADIDKYLKKNLKKKIVLFGQTKGL